MPIYYGLPDDPLAHPAHLTIGSFDGIHRGHQVLITSMVEAAHAAGCLAGMLTFHPHPVTVLRPDIPLSYLTTPEERAEITAALGVDFTVVLPFTRETAATSAQDFVHMLVERLHLKALWVGPDFALGRGREGNIERLAALGDEYGYKLHVLTPFDLEDGPVRSSRLRALLRQDGAVDRAAELLGRPYQVWGQVQLGARRGRGLGFPTANLDLPPGRLIPAFGVYACWAWLENRGLPAAVGIGVRPTFDNGQSTIEAYLLDFDGDLYGKTMGLSFIRRLRPELRFDSPQDLVKQMETDVAATRAILSDPPDQAGSPGEGWEELAHTADWAISVHGKDQRQLFARAASAMFLLQDAEPSHRVTLARAIKVSAENPEELLVAWLNQLLLDQELGGEMYTRFEIHEMSAVGLRGIAYGYAGTPLHTAIKAVTYYDLKVGHTAEGWTATVTFDV